jgi:hypothetical protein
VVRAGKQGHTLDALGDVSEVFRHLSGEGGRETAQMERGRTLRVNGWDVREQGGSFSKFVWKKNEIKKENSRKLHYSGFGRGGWHAAVLCARGGMGRRIAPGPKEGDGWVSSSRRGMRLQCRGAEPSHVFRYFCFVRLWA